MINSGREWDWMDSNNKSKSNLKEETIIHNAYISLYAGDNKKSTFYSSCEIDYERIDSVFTETKIDESSKWVEYDDSTDLGFWATALKDLLLNYSKVNIEPILN